MVIIQGLDNGQCWDKHYENKYDIIQKIMKKGSDNIA